MEGLQSKMQKFAEELYKNVQQQAPAGDKTNGQQASTNDSEKSTTSEKDSKKDEDVIDADFDMVNEEKSK